MPNDFSPVLGHRFTFRTAPQPGFDGVVHCEVVDLVPPRLLRLAWRGGTLDTTVTWTLRPEGRGTRLFLEHAGFDPDDPAQYRAFTIMGGGWRSHVLRRLATLLSEVDG
jgi:uncharacterized protein YndB with AHSA1/START domain